MYLYIKLDLDPSFLQGFQVPEYSSCWFLCGSQQAMPTPLYYSASFLTLNKEHEINFVLFLSESLSGSW